MLSLFKAIYNVLRFLFCRFFCAGSMDNIDEETFRRLGNEIMGRRNGRYAAQCTEKRRFHAFFGTTPFICALLWAMIEPSRTLPRGYHPKHLLWALMFMKVYASEPVHRRLAGNPDEKTFRKWVWLFVHAIEGLEQSVVSFFLPSLIAFLLLPFIVPSRLSTSCCSTDCLE